MGKNVFHITLSNFCLYEGSRERREMGEERKRKKKDPEKVSHKSMGIPYSEFLLANQLALLI